MKINKKANLAKKLGITADTLFRRPIPYRKEDTKDTIVWTWTGRYKNIGYKKYWDAFFSDH